MAEKISRGDPNAQWFEEQEHANDVLPDETRSVDNKRRVVIVPPGRSLNLHKPRDIGEQSWQKTDN